MSSGDATPLVLAPFEGAADGDATAGAGDAVTGVAGAAACAFRLKRCDLRAAFAPLPDGALHGHLALFDELRVRATLDDAAQHACSPIGLTCAYPGQGDGTSNGCYSTAMGWCRSDAGDAGDGEAGSGSWVLAQ